MGKPNRKPVRSAPTPATAPPAILGFAAIQDPELSARDCKILWALAHWAWGTKANCWPSNEQIARLIGYKPRAIQKGLKQLEARGHVFRRMEKTQRGWYRVLTIAERYRPALTIVGGEGGSAPTCATPGAPLCATPAHNGAPPLAHVGAPQCIEDPEGEKKKLAAAATSQGRGSPPPPGPAEPEWLKVDQLSPAEVEEWRQRAAEPGPFGRIARRIVERLDQERPTAPGTPSSPPEAVVEGNPSQSLDSTGNTVSSQDK